MAPHLLITGHEQVTAVFGRWPSFHDGEVQRLVLDSTRRDANGSRIATIELTVRGWNMRPSVTDSGFYAQENDSIVEFLFQGVYDVELDGLNHQNVLSELSLSVVSARGSEGSPHVLVELEHCFGLSGSFKASTARVVAVKPYVETAV